MSFIDTCIIASKGKLYENCSHIIAPYLNLCKNSNDRTIHNYVSSQIIKRIKEVNNFGGIDTELKECISNSNHKTVNEACYCALVQDIGPKMENSKKNQINPSLGNKSDVKSKKRNIKKNWGIFNKHKYFRKLSNLRRLSTQVKVKLLNQLYKNQSQNQNSPLTFVRYIEYIG